MTALYSDVRYAFRALAASGGFVALAVLCLGVGIGASTMMFSAVDSVLLEGPPFTAPERLLSINEVRATAPGVRQPVSHASYRDLQNAGVAVADLAALQAATFSIGADGAAEHRTGAFATANLFPVLGVVPKLGRGFVPGDEAAGAEPVVLLSDETWRRDYGGAPNVIGLTLVIDGRAHTIVGVLPSLLHARTPRNIWEARVWVPLESTPARGDRTLAVIGRLAAGATLESAATRFAAIGSELAAIHPERAEWNVRVEPFGGAISNTTRAMLLLGMGAAALVLLISCANVANLMLARATRRRREFAIRTALGASRSRIVRQLLAEGLMLGALGSILGLVIARWGRDWLLKAIAASQGVELLLPLDGSVLAFAVGVTLLACLLFSFVPALHAAHNSARATLGETGFGATTSRGAKRMRHGLVVAQVGAALALIVGAALLLRSFTNLMAVDGGIETANLLSVEIAWLGQDGNRADRPPPDVEGILAAVAALPGVRSTAAGDLLPLRTSGSRSPVTLADGRSFESDRAPTVSYASVTSGFFETLGTPIVRGRGLTPDDGTTAPVAVINERMARQIWPDADPLGRQFTIDALSGRSAVTVVGISRGVANWDQSDRPLPTAYVHYATLEAFPQRLLVRTVDATPGMAAAIGNAIRSIEPEVGIAAVMSMDEVRRSAFWRQEVFSSTLAMFGAAALLLTLVGLYGVLAYLVRLREREIGIRIALGSNGTAIMRMVLGQGVKLVAAGIALGLAGAYMLARLMRGLLFGVEPFDVALVAAVTVMLAGVALAACVAPARRATRIDPRTLLRD